MAKDDTRVIPGVPGKPSNLVRKRQEEYFDILTSELTLDQFREIIKVEVKKALMGEQKAIEFLINKLTPPADKLFEIKNVAMFGLDDLLRKVYAKAEGSGATTEPTTIIEID
jgi:hypothetical protein